MILKKSSSSQRCPKLACAYLLWFCLNLNKCSILCLSLIHSLCVSCLLSQRPKTRKKPSGSVPTSQTVWGSWSRKWLATKRNLGSPKRRWRGWWQLWGRPRWTNRAGRGKSPILRGEGQKQWPTHPSRDTIWVSSESRVLPSDRIFLGSQFIPKCSIYKGVIHET